MISNRPCKKAGHTMVNFRDSQSICDSSSIEKVGIEDVLEPEECPKGKFAGLDDPKGNSIERWQLV